VSLSTHPLARNQKTIIGLADFALHSIYVHILRLPSHLMRNMNDLLVCGHTVAKNHTTNAESRSDARL